MKFTKSRRIVRKKLINILIKYQISSENIIFLKKVYFRIIKQHMKKQDIKFGVENLAICNLESLCLLDLKVTFIKNIQIIFRNSLLFMSIINIFFI